MKIFIVTDMEGYIVRTILSTITSREELHKKYPSELYGIELYIVEGFV